LSETIPPAWPHAGMDRFAPRKLMGAVAAVHESAVVQVFGRRQRRAIHALRRPAFEGHAESVGSGSI
jgi:hypothetical protein